MLDYHSHCVSNEVIEAYVQRDNVLHILERKKYVRLISMTMAWPVP